jgi:hypothetical protein
MFNIADIDVLVERFEKTIDSRSKKTRSTFIADFRTVVKDYIQIQLRELELSDDSDGECRPSSWNRLWVSQEFGGKQYFPKDYQRIKKAAQQAGKANSFQILARLRSELEEEDGQERWQEWYQWVQETHPNPPTDPPMARQKIRNFGCRKVKNVD